MMKLVVSLALVALITITSYGPPIVSVLALSPLPDLPASRRMWISQVLATGTAWLTLSSSSSPSTAAVPSTTPNELPPFLRQYTKLAPLGPKINASMESSPKTRGLSMEELATRLSHDLTQGATGQGGYFLTGDLSTDLFRDEAVFVDPTNRVASLSQYQQALRILFDPTCSTVEFVDGQPLIAHPSTRTITGRIRSRGYLQLPWHPYIPAYESTIVYTVDEEGLIVQQEQTWTKAALRALQESFTPSIVGPPLASSRKAPPSEPPPVTKLFDIVNGRRPYEYTLEERQHIDQSVEQIIRDCSTTTTTSLPPSTTNAFDRTLLPGTWILAYLQPGPNGAGIDRRIPFPELDINDSFQIFDSTTTDGTTGTTTTTTIRNVGQVLGPWANVQVYGTLEEDNPQSLAVPKRFRANIQGGQFCLGVTANQSYCIDLPIQGEGLFDSLYLGDRLRIGQNLNGGGARVVQIRLDDGVSIL